MIQDFNLGDSGVIEIAIEKHADDAIKTALRDFVHRPKIYKEAYLQSKYKVAFDGYSYLGQKDSLNQYDTDLLHSFVLSEFTDQHKFPEEFHNFFNEQWASLLSVVRRVEKEAIQQLNIDGLGKLYDEQIGHMLSCNYYPRLDNPKNIQQDYGKRLSTHKDVSLFTVFLFGIDDGFSYQDASGAKIKGKNKVLLFPGYLMELLTQGRIKAVEHQVDMPENGNGERFSFAFFSIPKPKGRIKLNTLDMTSEFYYETYLSLF